MRHVVVVALIVVFTGACARARAPEPVARAVYVQDAATLIAQAEIRDQLAAAVRAHRITHVVPYGLGPLLANPSAHAQLAAWLIELRHMGARVITPIAGADRLRTLATFVAAYPGARPDGMITELEFWNRDDRVAAFDELLALVAEMRAVAATWSPRDAPIIVGAYLGYPTEAEAERLVEELDFVFLDYSVTSPERAWNHVRGTTPLRDRFGWFAAAGASIWPIFYAAGEVDMRPAIEAGGADGAERAFRADLEADTRLHGSHVAGFAYFPFEAMPASW